MQNRQTHMFWRFLFDPKASDFTFDMRLFDKSIVSSCVKKLKTSVGISSSWLSVKILWNQIKNLMLNPLRIWVAIIKRSEPIRNESWHGINKFQMIKSLKGYYKSEIRAINLSQSIVLNITATGFIICLSPRIDRDHIKLRPKSETVLLFTIWGHGTDKNKDVLTNVLNLLGSWKHFLAVLWCRSFEVLWNR